MADHALERIVLLILASFSARRLANLNVGAAPIQDVNGGSCDFGLIGLAVMGQNLIMNGADHGFKVCAFNRTVSKVDRFLANEAQGKSIVGAHSLEEFVSNLKKPRVAMLLVQISPLFQARIC
ncbi:MAG: hypothetical protein M1834_008315 [Cirrosporium novae-zelandiae]|nr:MAG: hypothetical protein M1834_008315 [Cirrosporium novae-zelandiae]